MGVNFAHVVLSFNLYTFFMSALACCWGGSPPESSKKGTIRHAEKNESSEKERDRQREGEFMYFKVKIVERSVASL